MATCILVPAYGQYGSVLAPETVKRLDTALERAKALSREGESVVLVFMTGNRKENAVDTIAAMMKRYVGHSDFNIVANEGEMKVWGTILELEWGYREAEKFFGSSEFTVEVVTNARHGRRVRITNSLVMKVPNLRVVESGDPPSALYHEVLGYGKLGLYLTGFTRLIKWAEVLRRRFYTAG